MDALRKRITQLERLVFSGYRFIKRRDHSGVYDYYVDTDDAGISCDTPQAAIAAAIAHLEKAQDG